MYFSGNTKFNKPATQLVNANPVGLYAYETTTGIAAGHTTTPLENYTGLQAPNNATHRAAIDWSSGIQVKNGAVGMFLNGFATPTISVNGAYAGHWSAAAGVNAGLIKPFNNGKHIHFKLDMRLGEVYCAGASGGQIYVGVGFHIGGVARALVIILWDNRSSLNMDYAQASDMHGTAFSSSSVGPGAYYTKNYRDTTMLGSQGWRNRSFTFDITTQNMQRLLDDNGWNVPVGDVKLDYVTFQSEIWGPKSLKHKTSQFGVVFDNTIIAVF